MAELLPSALGIVLTAFVLWHVLKVERVIEDMVNLEPEKRGEPPK